MKLGVFFLQNAQTAHGGVRLHTVRQEDLIRQKAFKHGRGGVFLRTESLPGIRVREARYGAHAARGDFLRKAEFPTRNRCGAGRPFLPIRFRPRRL